MSVLFSPLIPLPGPSPRFDGEKGLVELSAPHIPSPRLRGEGGGSRLRGIIHEGLSR